MNVRTASVGIINNLERRKKNRPKCQFSLHSHREFYWIVIYKNRRKKVDRNAIIYCINNDIWLITVI